MILKGLNEILQASVNARRCLPSNVAEDLPNIMREILREMLSIQNRIILSL